MSIVPYNNVQPFLTITEAINLQGVYPTQGAGTPYGTDYIGALHYYAFSFAPRGTGMTSGQTLSIASNTTLYSILGTTYGGNGVTTFQLPDLRGRIEVASDGVSTVLGQKFGIEYPSFTSSNLDPYFGGTSAPAMNVQPSLVVTPVINVQGTYGDGGSDILGAVWNFAGNFAPTGTLPCDGRLLNISEYTSLYTLIGTTYGGDGETTFALPDLRGRTLIGSGTVNGTTYVEGSVLGSDTFVLGANNMPTAMGYAGIPFNNLQPSLVMDFYISTSGIYSSSDSGGPGGGATPVIGEIIAFAGNNLEATSDGGWVRCDGRLLQIADNEALFSLIGTTYGGDGETTFALPNLTGRAIMSQGTGPGLGERFFGEFGGSATTSLALYNVPSVAIHDGPTSHTVIGANQDDFLYGATGNDTLLGLIGNDYIEGNGGNDRLDGGTGADTMLGGVGDDTYVVDNAGDVVTELANSGTDTVESSIDYTLGADVENLILTGSALKGTGNSLANTITGNGLDNVLHGKNGDDTVIGGDGNDTLYGELGNDNLQGGNGNDALRGDAGADTMAGGAGDDTYYFDNANDKAIELAGEGNDVVYASVDYTLGAGSSIQALRPTSGLAGVDNINLTGNELNQTIYGNAGSNILSGMDGADILLGKDGNDTLRGGAGSDTLTGDAGSDHFVFDAALGAGNVDTVTDFTHAVDKIDLAATVFTALSAGPLSDAQFYAGASAHDVDDRIIYDPSTGNLFYDADGNGAAAQVLIAKLGAGLTVTHDDFGVI